MYYYPYFRHGCLIDTIIAWANAAHGCKGNYYMVPKILERIVAFSRLGPGARELSIHVFAGTKSPKEALLSHTLFGVYGRGMSPKYMDSLSEKFIIEGKHCLIQMPRSATRPPLAAKGYSLSSTALRCCPSCLDSDMEQQGFGDWVVLHQIPAITHCPTHGIALIEHARRTFGIARLPSKDGAPLRTNALHRSAGYANYLRYWKLLFDARLPQVSGHHWSHKMRHTLVQLGSAREALGEIERSLIVTWGRSSGTISKHLGLQVAPSFVMDELNLNAGLFFLPQRLVLLTALEQMGIACADESELALSEASDLNTHGIHARLTRHLVDAGLPAGYADAFLSSRRVKGILEATLMDYHVLWRTLQGIPSNLKREIASSLDYDCDWARQ